MGPKEILLSLAKVFLYFALAFILLSSLYDYQPLTPSAKIIISTLVIIEAISLIRKIDNRNKK
ncbi:hypothetical protein BN1058_02535 [Paraliobacillus sp. PM-2]|uniref:hypothetical protein n=1 Tax=Paraliobacillus sp. PM-2 TaxID=1462524 RepID=UPI00061BC0DC|nr:hypothetical protein [Paraliobacillus sp. PM-2]CQR48186.1 hypothetical protein BN1058_02535 [Paraliobacillus sp. PM-2]